MSKLIKIKEDVVIKLEKAVSTFGLGKVLESAFKNDLKGYYSPLNDKELGLETIISYVKGNFTVLKEYTKETVPGKFKFSHKDDDELIYTANYSGGKFIVAWLTDDNEIESINYTVDSVIINLNDGMWTIK